MATPNKKKAAQEQSPDIIPTVFRESLEDALRGKQRQELGDSLPAFLLNALPATPANKREYTALREPSLLERIKEKIQRVLPSTGVPEARRIRQRVQLQIEALEIRDVMSADPLTMTVPYEPESSASMAVMQESPALIIESSTETVAAPLTLSTARQEETRILNDLASIETDLLALEAERDALMESREAMMTDLEAAQGEMTKLQAERAALQAKLADYLPTVYVTDDFTNDFNQTEWSVVKPKSTSTLEIVSGQAKLTGGVYLVTKEDIDPAQGGIKISGDWTPLDSGEHLQVLTRFDRQIILGTTDASKETEAKNAIEFFVMPSSGEISIRIRQNGTATTLIKFANTTEFPITVGKTYHFEATDDGNSLGFTVTDVQSAKSKTIIVQNTTIMGKACAFEDRAGGTRKSLIDNVKITSLSAPQVTKAITDTFDTVLGAQWTGKKPASTSTITEVSDKLQLKSGALIVSKEQFDPRQGVLSLSAEITPMAVSDQPMIFWRSSGNTVAGGTSATNQKLTDGVSVVLNDGGDTFSIVRWTNGAQTVLAQSKAMKIVSGQTYRIDVKDDGLTITATATDVKTGQKVTITGKTDVYATGNYAGLGVRPGSAYVSLFNNFKASQDTTAWVVAGLRAQLAQADGALLQKSQDIEQCAADLAMMSMAMDDINAQIDDLLYRQELNTELLRDIGDRVTELEAISRDARIFVSSQVQSDGVLFTIRYRFSGDAATLKATVLTWDGKSFSARGISTTMLDQPGGTTDGSTTVFVPWNTEYKDRLEFDLKDSATGASLYSVNLGFSSPYKKVELPQQKAFEDLNEGRTSLYPLTPQVKAGTISGPNVLVTIQSPDDESLVYIEGDGMLSSFTVDHDGGTPFATAIVTMNGDKPSGEYRVVLKSPFSDREIDSFTLFWDKASKQLTLIDQADQWTPRDYSAALQELQGVELHAADLNGAIAIAIEEEAINIMKNDAMSIQFGIQANLPNFDMHNPNLFQYTKEQLYNSSPLYVTETQMEAMFYALGSDKKGESITETNENLHDYWELMTEVLYAGIDAQLKIRNGVSQSQALLEFENRYVDLTRGDRPNLASLAETTGITIPGKNQVLAAAGVVLQGQLGFVNYMNEKDDNLLARQNIQADVMVQQHIKALEDKALEDSERLNGGINLPPVSYEVGKANQALYIASLQKADADEYAQTGQMTRRDQRNEYLVSKALIAQVDPRAKLVVQEGSSPLIARIRDGADGSVEVVMTEAELARVGNDLQHIVDRNVNTPENTTDELARYLDSLTDTAKAEQLLREGKTQNLLFVKETSVEGGGYIRIAMVTDNQWVLEMNFTPTAQQTAGGNLVAGGSSEFVWLNDSKVLTLQRAAESGSLSFNQVNDPGVELHFGESLMSELLTYQNGQFVLTGWKEQQVAALETALRGFADGSVYREIVDNLMSELHKHVSLSTPSVDVLFMGDSALQAQLQTYRQKIEAEYINAILKVFDGPQRLRDNMQYMGAFIGETVNEEVSPLLLAQRATTAQERYDIMHDAEYVRYNPGNGSHPGELKILISGNWQTNGEQVDDNGMDFAEQQLIAQGYEVLRFRVGFMMTFTAETVYKLSEQIVFDCVSRQGTFANASPIKTIYVGGYSWGGSTAIRFVNAIEDNKPISGYPVYLAVLDAVQLGEFNFANPEQVRPTVEAAAVVFNRYQEHTSLTQAEIANDVSRWLNAGGFKTDTFNLFVDIYKILRTGQPARGDFLQGNAQEFDDQDSLELAVDHVTIDDKNINGSVNIGFASFFSFLTKDFSKVPQ